LVPSSSHRADPAWPCALADLGRKEPERLRVRGTLPPDHAPAVAIVGSRDASPVALDLAWSWARELASRGVVVWSGGAVGVDTAAHEGALEAGGATVAVLGGGLARPFPPENRPLFDRIAGSGRGAVVSCVADDVPAGAGHFLFRNAVIAACTRALIVVEARLDGGAQKAAASARRLDRPVGVVPFTPGSGLGEGNVIELTVHRAFAVFSVADVMALLETATTVRPVEPRGRRRRSPDRAPSAVRAAAPPPPPPEDPWLLEVLGHLAAGPRHVDALCAATGRAAAEIGRALFALAVEGHVVEAAPGLWGAA
jgi:DNA processing protein